MMHPKWWLSNCNCIHHKKRLADFLTVSRSDSKGEEAGHATIPLDSKLQNLFALHWLCKNYPPFCPQTSILTFWWNKAGNKTVSATTTIWKTLWGAFLHFRGPFQPLGSQLSHNKPWHCLWARKRKKNEAVFRSGCPISHFYTCCCIQTF